MKHFYTILKLLLSIILLPIVGCSSTLDSKLLPTAEWLIEHPYPHQIFIVGLEPMPGTKGDKNTRLCVRVNQSEIMEQGDDDITLHNSLRNRLSIKLDNSTLDNDSAIFRFDGPEFAKYNSDGTLRGTFGGTQTCYITNLAKGAHLAQLSLKSMSGIHQYDYQWAFVIE